MTTNSECAEVCNSLLKGEISAAETYRQALEKFEGENEANVLREMLSDHQESIGFLRENVRKMGGEPVESSGAWGSFAQAVEGTSKLFGDSSALSALKQGEEKGKKDYERALDNDAVDPNCKSVIRTTLIPRQEAHISTLERLRDTQ